MPDACFPMPDLDSILALCRTFPDGTEDMPWPDDLCFKIRGKIFASIVLSDGRFPRVTLKTSPDDFHRLLEIEAELGSAAKYVGREAYAKWVNETVQK